MQRNPYIEVSDTEINSVQAPRCLIVALQLSTKNKKYPLTYFKFPAEAEPFISTISS
jgi:hypothetical protein